MKGNITYNSDITVILFSGHEIIVEETSIAWPAERLGQIETAISQHIKQELNKMGLNFLGIDVAFRTGREPKDDLKKALESYEPDKEKFISTLVTYIHNRHKSNDNAANTYVHVTC